MLRTIRVAYFCEPQLGGTFSFYDHLRVSLPSDVELKCVSFLSKEAYEKTAYRNRTDILYWDINRTDGIGAAELFISKLYENGFDAIMHLAGGDPFITEIVPYLPSDIATFIRVPMMTRGAYLTVKKLKGYFTGVIAVSDRIKDDLVKYYHIDNEFVSVIYHGVDIKKIYLSATGVRNW